jgi:hypothetical protein
VRPVLLFEYLCINSPYAMWSWCDIRENSMGNGFPGSSVVFSTDSRYRYE